MSELLNQLSDHMRNFLDGQNKLNAKYELLLEKVICYVRTFSVLSDNCIFFFIYFFLQIDNLSYELSVDHKVIDIDAYIPFNSIEDIVRFCSPDDGLIELKKAAFRRRIYASSGLKDTVSTFVPSIIDAFFDGSPLLGTHKWPCKK